MLRKLTMALLILNWASLSMGAAPPVKIFLDQANPPFMFVEHEQPRGLYVKLIGAIFERAGLGAEFLSYPWKRALEAGEAGEGGIGGIYQNSKRLKIFDYSAPIFEERLLVYTRRDSKFKFTQVADLKGLQVGVIRGWSYGDDFDKAKEAKLFGVSENASDELNFEKLALDRLHVVVAVEQAGQQVIANHHFEELIASQPVALANNPTFVVFSKTKHEQALLNQFDKALNSLKMDGTYQTLIQDFFR